MLRRRLAFLIDVGKPNFHVTVEVSLIYSPHSERSRKLIKPAGLQALPKA